MAFRTEPPFPGAQAIGPSFSLARCEPQKDNLTLCPARPMQRGEQCKRSIAVVRHMIAQAFVLGAGLGMRLRPLTDDLPKPLVPIFEKPLITFALDHLIAAAGVESFVVNTHHLPDAFERFFRGRLLSGASASRLVHEPALLETGGGIKNARTLARDKAFLRLQRRHPDRSPARAADRGTFPERKRRYPGLARDGPGEQRRFPRTDR